MEFHHHIALEFRSLCTIHPLHCRITLRIVWIGVEAMQIPWKWLILLQILVSHSRILGHIATMK